MKKANLSLAITVMLCVAGPAGAIDIAVTSIRPVDTVSPSTSMGATITNLGQKAYLSVTLTYNLWDSAGVLLYSDTKVTSLTGDSLRVDFGHLAFSGSLHNEAYIQPVSGDTNHANDTIRGALYVSDPHDVRVERIISPTANVDTLPVTPALEIRNYGTTNETFWAWNVIIYLGDNSIPYYDSVRTRLNAGAGETCNFPVWNGHHDLGQYLDLAFTAPPGDSNPNNDTIDLYFSVVPGGGVAEHTVAGAESGAPALDLPTLVTYGSRVHCRLPQPGNVRLTLYALDGRLARTMFDGPIRNQSLDLDFNPAGLASGIYFLSLEADAKTLVRKIVLEP
jgi:hypothetical protein